MPPPISEIESAAERIADEEVVRRTPIEVSRSISDLTKANVLLKMEHLQRTGSFKTRGALNKLMKLVENGSVERVVASSAGNHAQGVALAAEKTGVKSTIVMPENAPHSKVHATRSYGADIHLVGSNFQEAMEFAMDLSWDNGWPFIHAYDDPDIVAGQGTLALEIIEDVPDLDTVVIPIGGGGLISGMSTVLAERAPDVRVIGVQATGALTVPQSLEKGCAISIDDPRTIADGIATGGISADAYECIEKDVAGVVPVTDDEIAQSILFLLERAKQLVEGAGAVSVAACLSDKLDIDGETVVAILSGGNIDISRLQTVLTHASVDRHQLLQLRVRIEDEPGKMETIAGAIAEHGANIRTVRHDRAVENLRVGEAYLFFQIVTGGKQHAKSVIEEIRDRGFEVTRID